MRATGSTKICDTIKQDNTALAAVLVWFSTSNLSWVNALKSGPGRILPAFSLTGLLIAAPRFALSTMIFHVKIDILTNKANSLSCLL